MTINKSQGQSLKRTGLYLPDVCFAHEQLFVAFFRCGYPPDDNKTRTGLKVVVQNTAMQGVSKEYGGLRQSKTQGVTTPNIVFKEIFE